jgi:hypothetical protein
MTNRTDLLIILAVLGIAVLILWKAGIFKIANTASDIAEGAGSVVQGVADVANTATQKAVDIVNGAGGILDDVIHLPDNIEKLAETIRDSGNTQIAQPTQRAINIVNALSTLYPNLDRTTALKMNARDGIRYDSNGFPINPQDARPYLPL